MGVVTPVPLRTYPDGFPDEIIEQLRDATGRGVLCNRPYSGTAVIDDFGEQHLATGDLIVYTSADSVLQIAAHVDEVPTGRAVRGLRRGARDHVRRARRRPRDRAAVPRRARAPSSAPTGARTSRCRRRRAPTWTSCSPPACRCTRSARSGRSSTASASTSSTRAPTNAAALAATAELIDTLDGGFVFTNLVETDQVFGHRGDVPGFHGALQAIDAEVGRVARAPGPGARPADHHRRPRLRPDHARHRPHARARAAARALRRARRPPPRRSVRGRRRVGPAVADRPRRGASRDAVSLTHEVLRLTGLTSASDGNPLIVPSLVAITRWTALTAAALAHRRLRRRPRAAQPRPRRRRRRRDQAEATPATKPPSDTEQLDAAADERALARSSTATPRASSTTATGAQVAKDKRAIAAAQGAADRRASR